MSHHLHRVIWGRERGRRRKRGRGRGPPPLPPQHTHHCQNFMPQIPLTLMYRLRHSYTAGTANVLVTFSSLKPCWAGTTITLGQHTGGADNYWPVSCWGWGNQRAHLCRARPARHTARCLSPTSETPPQRPLSKHWGAGALLLEEIGCCSNTFALAILLLLQGDLYSARL